MNTKYNKALIDHLKARSEAYAKDWLIDYGMWCETCDYGGGPEIDYDKLLVEIDAFSKTFQKTE